MDERKKLKRVLAISSIFIAYFLLGAQTVQKDLLFKPAWARSTVVDTAAKNHGALGFFRRSGFGREIRHVYLSQNLENDPRYIQRNDDASEDDTDD